MAFTGRTRSFRNGRLGIAVAAAAVLLSSLLSGCSAALYPGSGTAAPQSLAGVPVTVTGPAKAAAVRVSSSTGTPFRATQTQWPAAATASALVQAAASGLGSGPVARLAGTPLWVQSVGAAQSAGATQVTATVLPHSQAAGLGVPGVVFQLDGAAPGSGRLKVGLDYASFAQAYGGNYGTRLHLAELPACALTTPAVAACRKETPLGSVQDYKGSTVTAQVTLAGAPAVSTMSYDAAAPAAAAGLLLAATSSNGQEGGAGGTYPATKLAPSGTWSEGGDSGAFTYSYPISVPSSATSLAPSLTLSYNSQEADGQTATTQAQSDWLGDGWSTPDSYISLETTPCSDNPEGTASPASTGDMCYDGEIVQMALDGTDTPLVFVSSSTSSGVTTSTWKPQADSGEVITHVAQGSTVFGKYDTSSPGSDYWTVTERDGTKYTFGMQQLPGYASADADTNSVDWMPVYSAHSGDPCYSSSGFTSSACDMAYEWHLDYVTDVHSDAMAYFYDQDTNYYGEDNGASDVAYISDSYLDHVVWGWNTVATTGSSAYSNPPDQVNFGAVPRCTATTCGALSTSNSSVATQYPDVPVDLMCASGANCTSYSPSMFSQVRLASITTEQYSPSAGAYEDVDSYAFSQTEPGSGDGLSPTLWLGSITRTGEDATAGGSGQVTLPSVSFGMIDMQNRVFTTAYPGLYRYRIDSVTNETGGQTSISYGSPDPCSSSYSSSSGTSVTSANTDSCFPVYWTPPGNSTPVLDWFESYAVTQVTARDTTGGSLNTETDYSYGGGAAWHFDDNLTVEPQYRTWGQFRGYATVTTETGTAGIGPQTESTVHYYRGMDGDPLASGTASVSLSDSQGGSHADAGQLAGDALESTTYQGLNGPVVSSTVSSYWVSAATATMDSSALPVLAAGSISVPPLTANLTALAENWTRTALTDGGETGKWNDTETDYTYDAGTSDPDFGLLEFTYSHTDPVNTAYDHCATAQYAPANTAENLVGLPSYAVSDQVACGGYAAGPVASAPGGLNTLTAPASVTAAETGTATRTFYDTASTTYPQASPPATGNVTVTQQAASGTPGSFTWQTGSTDTHDDYGRVLAAADALGHVTTTAYTMSGGLTTGVTVTAPPTTYDNAGTTVTTAHVTSTVLSPARGLTLTSTDQNNTVTTEQYDELGRLTSVWEDGRPVGDTPNITYTYTVSDTGLSGVVTDTLDSNGNPFASATIYDSLGRVRQTQSTGVTGTGSGRVVTDTLYDTHGWAQETSANWYDSSSLPALALAQTNWSTAPDVDEFTYDGAGRQVEDTSVTSDTAEATTVTAYNGDSATTIPGIPAAGVKSGAVPANAGTVQTTATNPIGQTASVSDYTANPTLTIPSNTTTGTFSVSGGTPDPISYAYDAAGNQVRETLGDVSWSQAYNLLGQQTSTTDPDAGTSTMSYDAAGNLRQAKDGAGNYTSYTYDEDNRKTAEYAAASASQVPFGSAGANETASWVYDNANSAESGMTDPAGQETTENWYSGSYDYKVQQIGFNAFGESTGEIFYIPSGAPGSAITTALGFQNVYNGVNGMLERQILPAGAGLPLEQVNYSTTGGPDLPDSVSSSLAGYAENTSYYGTGQPEAEQIGPASGESQVKYTYDPRTQALTGQLVTNAAGTALDDTSYTYSPAGDLTAETDEQNGSASQEETQCFNYTTNGQLSQAWTATDGCAATPTTTSYSTVGDSLGTASRYDESWTYNALGEPVSKSTLDAAGTGFSTTAYGYSSTAPTELTSATTTGATSSSYTYGYNAVGEQASRTAAQGAQTLTWNSQGQLTGADTTSSGATVASYVYDASGNLFAQTDAAGTTIYLDGEQLTISGTTLSGVRLYQLPGGITAVRTGSGSAYGFEITSDQHGTNTLYLDYTAQKPAWRQYDPYGNPRGTAPAAGTFPGSRGFLNDPTEAGTGLTSVGARWYDPLTGTFASLDPLLEKASQAQLNGYTYAGMNPVDGSDPSGDTCVNANACYDPLTQTTTYTPTAANPAPGPTGPSGGGGTYTLPLTNFGPAGSASGNTSGGCPPGEAQCQPNCLHTILCQNFNVNFEGGAQLGKGNNLTDSPCAVTFPGIFGGLGVSCAVQGAPLGNDAQAGDPPSGASAGGNDDSLGYGGIMQVLAQASEDAADGGGLSDLRTRQLYLAGERNMAVVAQDLADDPEMSPEQRAETLFNMRNALRTAARSAMADQAKAAEFNEADPNMTWDQIVAKYEARGFSGDALWDEIAAKSSTSRSSVNQSLGLQP